jgi:serine protease Do
LWVVAAAVLLGGSAARGQNVQADRDEMKSSDALRAVFRAVTGVANQSTVSVRAVLEAGADPRQVAFGTVVSADGYVLTKASEVIGRKQLQVVGAGGGGKLAKVYAASVVGLSEPLDLAMLKIEATGLVPVSWADMKADHVAVGEWVASAGPVALEKSEPVAVGVVSVGRRKIPGRLGFLGVMRGETPDESGAKMMQVISGSAAEKAGVKVDDVITAIDGKAVKTAEDLSRIVRGYRPGDVVMLTVRRGKTVLQLPATLGSNVMEEDASQFSMMNLLGGAVSKRSSDFSAVFQHDTVLSPMECGGPLVDLSGKVIGINIARAGRTETYALPADVVEPLLGPLENGKLAPVNANVPTTMRARE